MTGVPALPGRDIAIDVLEQMVQDTYVNVEGVSRVLFDMTAKPPGTTEWE